MKMLFLATLAVALSGLTGCQHCGDQNPCDDNQMFGMGMLQRKHFGFGHKKDCDACSTSGPILDGGIGQASPCGCDSHGQSAMMPVSMSNSGCGCGNSSMSQAMPAGVSGGEMSGLPAGTIVTESLPTPAQQPLGGMYRGASPSMATPGPE